MRVTRRKALGLVFGGLVVALAGAEAAQQPPARAASSGVSVERGKYLVTVQDCNGCHTPFKNGEPDMTRMLSGHPQDVKVTGRPELPAGFSTAINDTNTAWAGPWGVSFTTNLTPDRATGIGAWNEKTFINAIRLGKKIGVGRALLPPMPWKMYGNLTDDDLRSVFAYLKSIPPIANRVPNPLPPGAK